MPAPPPDPTIRGEISDFTPGIHQEASSTIPPGAADPAGTFGCFAAQDGYLTPLPRVAQIITPPFVTVEPAADPALPAIASTQSPEFRIVGLLAFGPIFKGGPSAQGNAENNTGIAVAVEWYESDDRHTRTFMYHRDYTVPQWDLIDDTTFVGTGFLPSAVTQTDFAVTRSNNADPSLAGPVVLVACSGTGHIFEFPDDTAPAVQASVFLPGDNQLDPTMAAISPGFVPVMICVHQGRLVTSMEYVTNFGATSFFDTNEQFFWSNVNDVQSAAGDFAAGGANYFKVHVGWEHPTGYQVMESLTADELLLIKAQGGAWVLRGDLNFFTAVNYPFVKSPGKSLCRGCRTSRGFIYPVDAGGIWMWTGGQTSINLSPQLPDDFWRVPHQTSNTPPDPLDIPNFHTAMDQFDVFAMCPNNWVWDSEGGGEGSAVGAWWRLADPDDYIIHRWSTDWRGVATYGVPSGFQDDESPCIYEIDRREPAAYSWSWLSHPIMPSVPGEVTFNEIIVTGSGVGSIQVRVTTPEDPLGFTVTFEIDGTLSDRDTQRTVLAVTGTQHRFQVYALSADPDDTPAPNLHSIRWEAVPANQLPTA